MSKVFRLKRIKTKRSGEGLEVIVYGHAARGREQRIGSFLTNPQSLSSDLAKYLKEATNLDKSNLKLET